MGAGSSTGEKQTETAGNEMHEHQTKLSEDDVSTYETWEV